MDAPLDAALPTDTLVDADGAGEGEATLGDGDGSVGPGDVAPEIVDGTVDLAPVDNGLPEDYTASDGKCEPDCEDKVCGADGCGGICGYCAYPLICHAEGQCVEVCPPDCDGKVCGPDGCGGLCGECSEELVCGDDGLCYEPACEPDCTDKVCGPNGCGGDCGLCAAPKVCVNGGCALGPCGTVTAEGECQGEVAVWCEDEVTLVEDDCADYEDKTCGYDGFQNQYACKDIGPCDAQCEGKVCGSDGCDGVCGSCTQGWACELGTCKPQAGADCGPITQVGLCDGDTVLFCAAGKLYLIDCTDTGETCKWDPAASSFGCL